MSRIMALISYVSKSSPSIRVWNLKFISTFSHLYQEAQLAEVAPPSSTSLPPNPATGSPLYSENWRNPIPSASAPDAAMIPISLGFMGQASTARLRANSQLMDSQSLMNLFADWMTSQHWADVKQVFESWIRSLDKHGKPNKPDVGLYNHYLRANLMMGSSAGELLDLVAQMDDYGISPNTASFNLILKAMKQANETVAAEKLIERMLQTGTESKEAQPDEESYDLVIGILLSSNQIDSAFKYMILTLKSGFMLSLNAFTDYVRRCARNARLDALISIIEKCKEMDQSKSLCPPWGVCNDIANVAMDSDNGQLTYYALEFMARWIARGEKVQPPVHLSVDEGLIVSAIGTASRTYNSRLLDGSWEVLTRSLRQKHPGPESYLAKIYAYANHGNLVKAFSTLDAFERAHGKSNQEGSDLFSPFYSLNPLVVACSKNGFETLDKVYYQLEQLSQADRPYKSVAALNCIILGCANIWDLDRAYQTFTAIDSSFGLSPNIHSYNALICAFGKLSKRDEAAKVFEHLLGLGVKPNVTTYSLLINAHLINRDSKAALSTIDDMITSGFEPSKGILKQVRRRCLREMDYESDEKVESLARQFNIRMGTEVRRNILFELQYATDYAAQQ